jgi:hypothetical protein
MARARVRISGDMCPRGHVPAADEVFELRTHEESVSIGPASAAGSRSTFSPKVVSLQTSDGEFVETLYNPRSSFAETPVVSWDPFKYAYIRSYTVWNCLTQPFLFTYPGFETRDLEPLEVSDEVWKRIEIIYPSHIAGHCSRMVCHVGHDMLMRRYDFQFDLVNGIAVTSFPLNYREVQGLLVPMTRSIFRSSDLNLDRPSEYGRIEISDLEYS